MRYPLTISRFLKASNPVKAKRKKTKDGIVGLFLLTSYFLLQTAFFSSLFGPPASV
jgi:hypothetical protein